ncbi:unnamed protein product, partial [Adineta steineri]
VIDNEIMDNEALMADINPPTRSTSSTKAIVLNFGKNLSTISRVEGILIQHLDD